MLREQVEQLRQEYIGRYVTVESDAPGLAALRGRVGQVKTINSNGHALIRFEGAHESWHDIEMDCVRVIDGPEPQPNEAPIAWPIIPDEPESTIQLSRLEIARLEKKAQQMAEEALANTAAEEEDKQGEND